VGTQQLFAVIRTRGAGWQDSHSLEGQTDWAPHASFLNALAKDGIVVLGGPLEGTPDVLLVMRAATPDEVRARLAGDPWTQKDLLRISRIAPWTLRLGSLDR
jgi:YCII-related domain